MKRRVCNRSLSLLVLLVLLASVAMSAEAAKKNVELKVHGKVRYEGTKGRTIVEGGLTILYDDAVITAKNAVMENETNKAKLTGGVTLTQKDVTLTADAMDMDIKKDFAVVTGNVRLEKREEQAEKDESGKPKISTVKLMCDTLEISTKTQNFAARGSVSMSKDKQKAQAQKANYDNAGKALELLGSVSIQSEDDKTIKCDRAMLYTDKELLEAEGAPVEITFEIED